MMGFRGDANYSMPAQTTFCQYLPNVERRFQRRCHAAAVFAGQTRARRVADSHAAGSSQRHVYATIAIPNAELAIAMEPRRRIPTTGPNATQSVPATRPKPKNANAAPCHRELPTNLSTDIVTIFS